MMVEEQTGWVAPREISRRHFLWLTAMTAAGVLAGCATNPVTGEDQLMLYSEEDEIGIDRQAAPVQFSADLGVSQDKALNAYVSKVGGSIAAKTHRPHMPYSFQVVNANYANAYAFPGGTIACTRAILLELQTEADLAALLGHEIGHVNARHTAARLSQTQLAGAILQGLSEAAATKGRAWGDAAGLIGGFGASLLLASYSREDERQADALGMEYMVKSGYNANGMVGVMEALQKLSQHEPGLVEIMFATHPMSSERYQTALASARGAYAHSEKLPIYRERYMDHTAKLRSMKKAIEEIQKGDQTLGQQKFLQAEEHYAAALKLAPRDYAALIMMSTCQLVQKKYPEGLSFAGRAKSAYPQEPQSYYLSGVARLRSQNYDHALQEFSAYEKLMPANPQVFFFKGYCQESLQHRLEAADEYTRYLGQVKDGTYAQHAYQRLVEWGYVQPQAPPPPAEQKTKKKKK
jgi:predicted Zn-dependent protease